MQVDTESEGTCRLQSAACVGQQDMANTDLGLQRCRISGRRLMMWFGRVRRANSYFTEDSNCGCRFPILFDR